MKKMTLLAVALAMVMSFQAVQTYADGGKHKRRRRFEVVEATIPQMQRAFRRGRLTSEELVKLYLDRIDAYEPFLNSFIEVNDNALRRARRMDRERRRGRVRGPLHGIPVLLKDIIDTKDIPTTAGSVALEGSFPPDDAFLTRRLRRAGAVILGKATLTEFANFLTVGMPAGYSSLGRFGFNPYDPRPLPGGDGRPVLSPGGSSSGSGAAVAANLVAVSIGTETSGSILSPAYRNMVVGIKPTLGLISRDGITPITADQDTAGPFGRTVTDAAILLGALTKRDPSDPATTVPGRRAFKDYTRFLRRRALRGARIGVPRDTYWDTLTDDQRELTEAALDVMRDAGAIVIDPAEIPSARELSGFGICVFLDQMGCSTVLKFGFKRDLNSYLVSRGPSAPVKSLAEVIAFNNANPGVALMYGQVIAEASEVLDVSPGSADFMRYTDDRAKDLRLSRDEGIDAVMKAFDLDALVFPRNRGANIAARAGYPSVMVPVGFLPPVDPVENPTPWGVSFTARAWSEGKLIALAYSFEQASKARRPPASTPPLGKRKKRRTK